MTQQSHSWVYIQKTQNQKFEKTLFKIAEGMETTSVSMNRRVQKEDVVHTYSGILFSHEKERSFAVAWMDLVGIMLSKMCQMEKEKCCVALVIHGI